MYKNLQNRIMALPQGTPNPWVNTLWMLVFSPFLLLLGAFAIGGLGYMASLLFKTIFG